MRLSGRCHPNGYTSHDVKLRKKPETQVQTWTWLCFTEVERKKFCNWKEAKCKGTYKGNHISETVSLGFLLPSRATHTHCLMSPGSGDKLTEEKSVPGKGKRYPSSLKPCGLPRGGGREMYLLSHPFWAQVLERSTLERSREVKSRGVLSPLLM